MRHVLFLASLAILALGLAIAAPAVAQTAVGAESSLDYQRGDFGTGQEVETLTARQTVRLRAGRAQAYASLPWQRIEAPANVVGGGGLLGLPIIIDPTQPATRSIRQGLGDLRIGAGYTIAAPGRVDLSLGGELKLPTASARRGLGTGETDLTLGAEAARRFGAFTPFLSLSYTMAGDPANYRLRDSLAARGGLGVRLDRAVHGTVGYIYARSASPLVENESQVTSTVEASLGRGLSLGLTGRAGLSDGSPDLGLGIQLGWRLF